MRSRIAVLFVVGLLALNANAGPDLAPAPRAELPPGVTQDWVDAVTRDLGALAYHFATDASGTATASNHAHELAARVATHGISVAPFRGAQAPRLELRLARYGREHALRDVGPGTLTSEGARAEIRRDALGLVEWYENRAQGIEQGWTIQTRPADAGTAQALVLELAADGALRAELSPDAQRVSFVDRDGKAQLHYGGLVALDANGARLPSALAVADGWVQIRVDDRAASYPVVIDPLLTTASWTPESNVTNSGFGGSVSTAGDFNGDGFSDIIVGAPTENVQSGRVYLFLGGAGGPDTTADATFFGIAEPERFGAAVAAAGNVNGDQFDDIVVGAPGSVTGLNNPYGRIAVFLGNAAGTLSNPTTATNCFNSNPANMEQLGVSVAGAGDVNMDGFDDVIAGGPSLAFSIHSGIACIYPGTNTGPGILTAGASVTRLSSPFAADPGVIDGVRLLGTAVSGAGDVNGDGFADVVVGAPGSRGTTAESVGAVFVYLGPPSSTPDWAQLGDNRSTQLSPTAEFGAAVADAGDLNGDGFADIAVGAPGNDQSATIGGDDRGAIYFFHGSASGIATPVTDCDPSNFFTNVPAQYCELGIGAGAQMGRHVAAAGDLNGDGLSDVIFSEPPFGRVEVVFGHASGAYLLAPPGTLSVSGLASIGTAGDTDGDGFSEVLVGVPSFTNGQSLEGQALLFRGTGDIPTTGQSLADPFFKVESNSPNTNLGIGITAGDVNGDGFSDIIMGAPNFDTSIFFPFPVSYTDDGGLFFAYGASCGPNCFPPYLINFFDFRGLQDGAQYGYSVSATGDVNGDGFADVLVGAPGYDEFAIPPANLNGAGRAYLHLGSAFTVNPGAVWTRMGFQGNAQTGFAVSIVGDVNGDGFADAIVGSPTSNEATGNQAGRAELFLGSPSGLAATPAWTAIGEGLGALYGVSVAGAGDVNRDGYADVIIGAWGNYNNDGRAYVYLGTAAGLSSSAAKVFMPSGSNQALGEHVATAGDANGDGFSDVIIGIPGSSRALVAAGPDFTTIADLSGPGGSRFGTGVGTPGDVNGDGLSDIVVGAQWEDSGAGFAQGSARLFLGSATAISTTAARTWADCPHSFCDFGRATAPAADVNGDGFGDLIVAGYRYANPDPDEGGVFMHYGNGVEGTDRAPRQLTSGGAPIQPVGAFTPPFSVDAIGRSAAGRTLVRLDVESKPIGTPFDFLGVVPGTTLDSGTTGVVLQAQPGCATAKGCKWRARVRSRNPHFPTSPWLSPPANARTESDLRLFRDFDGDGAADPADSCPTQTNSSADSDMDGVDQVCDTCSLAPNPIFTGALTNRTRVSRQLDDDADGRGNACDFDFDNTGPVITSTDFNQAKASVAKLVTQSNCGAPPTNNQRCGEFDHDLAGPVINAADFNLAKGAVAKVINTAFPKCAACTQGGGWSNETETSGERAGRPICESSVPGACVYAP